MCKKVAVLRDVHTPSVKKKIFQ